MWVPFYGEEQPKDERVGVVKLECWSRRGVFKYRGPIKPRFPGEKPYCREGATPRISYSWTLAWTAWTSPTQLAAWDSCRMSQTQNIEVSLCTFYQGFFSSVLARQTQEMFGLQMGVIVNDGNCVSQNVFLFYGPILLTSLLCYGNGCWYGVS